jgi:endonuclease/exonuclease/phosphatase family metal-dependent hydrolase
VTIGVLSMLFVVLSLVGSAVSATAETARPLRVVTFNLLHGGPTSGFSGDGGKLEQRLDIVGRRLAALDVDVVALQEASTTWGRGNVAARLTERLGLHYVYAPATTHVLYWRPLGWLVTSLMNFAEGEAVLSRFPIVKSDVVDLPRCLRFLDPRIALRTEIEAPGGRVEVVSVHTSNDACQIKRVAELARDARNGHPAIVMGDLNMTERTDAIEALRRDAGVIDAFRERNPEARGATTWQNIFASESTVRRRIDYIFVGADRPNADVIRASGVILDAPEVLPDGTTLWPSDHYGVLADVDVSGR